MKTVRNMHNVGFYTDVLEGDIGFASNDEIFFPLRTLYPSRAIPYIDADVFEKEYKFYGMGRIFKAFVNGVFNEPEKKFQVMEGILREYVDAVLNPFIEGGFKITVGEDIYLETEEGDRIALKHIQPEVFLIISPHFEFFVQFALFINNQSLNTIKIKEDGNGISYEVYLDKIADEFSIIMNLSHQSPYNLVYSKVKELFVKMLYSGKSNSFLKFFTDHLEEYKNALEYIPHLGIFIEAELIEKYISEGYFFRERDKLVKGLIYINSRGKKNEKLLFEAFEAIRPFLKERAKLSGININRLILESNDGLSYSFAPDSFDTFNLLALSLDSYNIEHKEERKSKTKIVI